MTIGAAGWPSVCAFSRSFPLFSSVEQSEAVFPPRPPPRSYYPPAPHISISFTVFTSITPSLPQLSSFQTPPRLQDETRSISLSHLAAHCHPSVWAHPLTHLQSPLLNCGTKFPTNLCTYFYGALENMRKFKGSMSGGCLILPLTLLLYFPSFLCQQMCGHLHERHEAVKWDKMRHSTPTQQMELRRAARIDCFKGEGSKR